MSLPTLSLRDGKYFARFRIRDASKLNGWRQCMRATGQSDKAAAMRVALEIVEAEESKSEATQFRERASMDILTRAQSDLARGALTKEQTQRYLAEITRLGIGADLERFSTRDWFEKWLAEGATKDSTRKTYTSYLEQFGESMGAKFDADIATVTEADAANFIRSQNKAGIRSSTVGNKVRILRGCFADAIAELKLATSNPFVRTRTLKRLQQKNRTGRIKRAFQPAELDALFASLNGDWKGCSMLGLYCGARISDAYRIRWRQIDLQGRFVTIAEKKKELEPALVIPMHSSLESWFLEHPSSDHGNDFVFPSLASRGRESLCRSFTRLITAAGIENEPVKPVGDSGKPVRPLGFHSLRRSNATLMANKDVPEEVRRKVVGHNSSLTHRLYSEIEMETIREGLSNLPSF